jgi:hypothetical protein
MDVSLFFERTYSVYPALPISAFRCNINIEKGTFHVHGRL